MTTSAALPGAGAAEAASVPLAALAVAKKGRLPSPP